MAQCRARSKQSGKQCKHGAIPGGAVCKWHGGGAPQVKAKARERLLDIIDPDRVFREMARIAFADTTQIFDATGNVRPIKDWPDALKRAVAGFEVVKRNLTAGDNEIDEVLKVKFWDKNKALQDMAKVLQMFVEKVEHTGGIEVKWQQ